MKVRKNSRRNANRLYNYRYDFRAINEQQVCLYFVCIFIWCKKIFKVFLFVYTAQKITFQKTVYARQIKNMTS